MECSDVFLFSNYWIAFGKKHVRWNNQRLKQLFLESIGLSSSHSVLFFLLYLLSYEGEELLKCLICVFVHCSITAISDSCFLMFEFPRNLSTSGSYCLQFCSWKH